MCHTVRPREVMELKKKNQTNPNQKSMMTMKMMMRVERFVYKLCLKYVILAIKQNNNLLTIFGFELQEDDDE